MIRVAIQGISGSYSDEAARAMLGDDLSLAECSDFESAFAAVRSGDAQHAVVPVENKIVGEIRPTASRLRSGEFQILEKLQLRVQHVLAGTPESEIDALESVRSHAEALKQCRRFLDNRPNWQQVIGADTASSIRRIVADGEPHRAAIGSERAASIYGAKILAENISDDIDNWTTFYLIGN